MNWWPGKAPVSATCGVVVQLVPSGDVAIMMRAGPVGPPTRCGQTMYTRPPASAASEGRARVRKEVVGLIR